MEIRPMLASAGTEELLNGAGYLFEPKLDGIRALCFKKSKLKFVSRNGKVITADYPEFTFFDAIDAKECVLDGEIVVYDEKGHPSFELWGEGGHSATYVVFDILYLDGRSLLDEPLSVRKKILEKVVKETDSLQVSVFTRDGKKLWELMKKRGLEGVVAKKEKSVYTLGARSSDWRKIKLVSEIDCVILGYTTQKRSLSSLALGLYVEEELVYAGKVGTGFDEQTMERLRKKLDTLAIKKPIIETESGVIPVEPVLVAQIRYQAMTKNHKLRAPVFVRLRDDKEPDECVVG